MNTMTSNFWDSNIPPKLDERETEMLGTRVRAAMFDALACADLPYATAGVTFEQDGRFTKAKHSGYTVVSLMGRFSKGILLQALRQNIAESAHEVACVLRDMFPRDLKLPSGHVFGFDVAASVFQVKHRGSRRLTAYVFQPPGSVGEERPTYHGEIHVDLYTCHAVITLKDGERWGGGTSVFDGETVEVRADTYGELFCLISETFNNAVAQLAGRPAATIQ